MWTHRRLGAALLLSGFLLAGCEDTTGPEIQPDEFDTAAALADYQAVEGALTADDFAGFRALAGRTPFSGAGGAALAIGPVAALLESGEPVGSRAFAVDFMKRVRAARTAPPVAAAPIISQWTRGATYVYSPDLDRYALAAGREGAPATGVRFILYNVDAQGTPIVDEEIGYSDLIDEGDASAEDIVLRLVVVANDSTLLDYRTTLTDNGAGSGTLTVDGYLQGDNNRVDFDISATGTDQDGRESLDLAYTLEMESRDFRVEGSVTGVEAGETESGSIDISVRHGSDSVQVSVEVTNGDLSGTIRLNGEVFATASGPEDDPTFVNTDGGALSTSELRLLGRVFDFVEDVFDFLEDLLDPVDDIVILGVIL